jgi:hypothetical protein
MRLTVGPLPAAVYWRRRAVVLGAVLLLVLLVSYTCSPPKSPTSSGPSKSPSAPASPKASLQPAVQFSPSPSTGLAGTGQPSPISSADDDGPVDPAACTDSELRVTAKPSATTVTRGHDVVIYLLIKNISGRTCTRNIGPDLQELRIVLGAEKVWSSDDCGTAKGNNVKSFQPNLEVSFNVDWNGRTSTICSGTGSSRAPAGPFPDPGRYQVLGRVGTDQSKAVTLTIS